jgi:RHS repeat-associated protein
MRSLSPSETLNAQRPTPNVQLNRRVTLLLSLLVSFCASVAEVHAQVGDNNPSGPSGIFNGLIADGVDPYTGNVRRSITDIAVAGAVGEYPLALVRTYNSRTPSFTSPFGDGGWNHSYNWILEDSPMSNTSNFQPARFTVDFPDGRVETFCAVTWDTYYRVRSGPDTPAQSTSAGVRERFQPLNGGYCNLILPDGGKIQFYAEQHNLNGQYYYKYTATAIVDPFGLTTTLTWETLTDGWKRLTRVTEPAGRYLQFTYTGSNSLMILQVTEFIAGVSKRYVNYYYTQNWAGRLYLDHVVYYNNSNWTAHYKYQPWNVQNSPFDLLWTADDPMYPGPMKRIAYEYAYDHDAGTCTWAVFGQILREKYWDGQGGDESNGPIISTLSVCTDGVHNGANYRMETRGDIGHGPTRGFVYTTDGYLTSCTDFMGHSASQGYDAKNYINSVTDRNSHTTNYTCDPITGNVTQVQFPLTTEDTPGQGNTRPTVNYTYTNNYYLHTVQDEGSQFTTIQRDGNNRVTQITYPDNGYEQFLSYNAFNQFQTHRMITGGNETFTYDGRGLKQTYRTPDNPTPGNPTVRYVYDLYDRVSAVTDVFGASAGDQNHSTSFTYNDRGQLTTTLLPNDPQPGGSRHTISYAYNDIPGPNQGDGTLLSVTDQLGNVTSYTYDDYRRVKSVTPPVRGDGSGLHTTYLYYDTNGTGDDYTLMDSNVTWVTLPSGKRTKAVYDNNRRKTSVTLAPGTADEATTSYGHDSVGNVISVINPLNRNNVSTLYDERNRPYSISVGGQTTALTYDTAGRKKTINRPNGQIITYDSFDAMNRVTQQTATDNFDPPAVTKYTYYTPSDGQNPPVGLLKTMQDPRLSSGTDAYTYSYDSMGRKRTLTYPLDSSNPPVHRTEQWSYDTAGRLQSFTNRDLKVQSFSYDALNRMTGFSWNDGGFTPGATFGYDVASRLTTVNNANATISRGYYNDNSLFWETETPTGGVANSVLYGYDADGNRGGDANSPGLQIPGYSFFYTYTNRNQLWQIKTGATTPASYLYDQRSNVTTRTLDNSTHSNYGYDGFDRVTSIAHALNEVGITRTFNYGYATNGNDRLWTKRMMSAQSPENNKGDVFTYDQADQAMAVELDVLNPDQERQPLIQSISYDANGNRTTFGLRQSDTYTTNNLNQYTSRNNVNAVYDQRGNLTTGLDGSTYQYDAQNRLVSAMKGMTSLSFKYDGLNRQVSRATFQFIPGGTTTYSVWDGWDLVQEYHMSGSNAVEDASYLYGPTGLVKNLKTNNYYYQDGSGSTSHLADSSGHLLEWYRYDLQGTPFFYNASDTQLSTSSYSVRHLFTGQQWSSDLGLYDLRNRFYSPDIGRFLQPDPIGFRGGSNLYRHCGNNPVKWSDPSGLANSDGQTYSEDRVIVTGSSPWGGLGDPGGIPLGIGFSDPSLGIGGGLAVYQPWGHMVGDRYVHDYNPFPRLGGDDQSSQQSAPPPQNPPTPVVLDPALLQPPLIPIYQALAITLPNGTQTIPMTFVKNQTQGDILHRSVYSRVPIFVPQGIDPQAIVNRFAGTTFPSNFSAFYKAFNPRNGTLNLKAINPIWDSFANVMYGWSGTAGGYPMFVLQGVGDAVHFGFNDVINVYDINLGIGAAQMGATASVVPLSDSDF